MRLCWSTCARIEERISERMWMEARRNNEELPVAALVRDCDVDAGTSVADGRGDAVRHCDWRADGNLADAASALGALGVGVREHSPDNPQPGVVRAVAAAA